MTSDKFLFSIITTITWGAPDGGAVVVVVGGLVVVVVGCGAVVVVVGAPVVVVVAGGGVPPLPPKSALKAAKALGKLPPVMSLFCPPEVSLNEKMLVKATL